MKKYDVIVIGAGITGTALFYVLSNYSNLKSIAIIEKHSEIAKVNSNRNNNSQTLHFGDIETNYSLEKARKVKEAADLVAAYVEKNGSHLFNKTHKMVLAVGEKEVQKLEERYQEIKDLYPNLEKIGWEEIAKLEPKIVKGRSLDQPILALCTEDGYAIDYGKLSESFIENGKGDVFLDTKIKEIIKKDDSYIIKSNKGIFQAKVVIVSAGAHSLIYAQKLGYGKELGLLPVAGSFYCSNKMLNGKVYTLQTDKLPFAAIHGDPDVNNPDETRFGPTTKVLPLLERYDYSTIPDFFRTSVFNWDGVVSLWKIITDPVLGKFVLKNLSYDIPILGKHIFAKEVRKIIPSIKTSELRFGKKIGGIRPQVVDTKTKQLNMGEAKLLGDNIIFNITPSPGASVCLKNAENDANHVVEFLGEDYSFDQARFRKDY